MSLTPQQHEVRRKGIGASEAAAVLGLSPFATPQDIYWRKIGSVEDEPTEAMQTGTRLEPTVVAWAAQKLGVHVSVEPLSVVHPSMPLIASPDALIVGRPEGIEAKTTSMKDEWGEEGTDEIPDAYVIQAQQQCFVLGLERVHVPVLIFAGYQPMWRLYCVERSEKFAGVADYLAEWWRKHVEARVPPTSSPPPMDFLKRLRRQPKSSVMLGQQAVEALAEREAKREARLAAEKASKEADAKLIAMLGIEDPAEEGILPDGTVIRYMEQSRSGYEVKATTFRTLKVRKA